LRAVIFANGLFNDPGDARRAIRPDDLLIAADGGLRYCLALGLTPAVLIGDFDSLDETEVETMRQAGVQIVRHPAQKDYTDLELAIRHAQALGTSEILVLAALGARWDQTLANLLLPANQELNDIKIKLLDGPHELEILHGGARLEIQGEPGDTVSLVPIGGNALGVITRGLQYPLNDEILFFGATRGVSNALTDKKATIQLKHGLIVCIVTHTVGIDDRR